MSCDFLKDVEERLRLNVLKIFNEIPECVRVGEFYIVEIRVDGKIYSKRFQEYTKENIDKFVCQLRDILNIFSCKAEIIAYKEKVRIETIYTRTEGGNCLGSSNEIGLNLGEGLGEISRIDNVKEFEGINHICEDPEVGSTDEIFEEDFIHSCILEEKINNPLMSEEEILNLLIGDNTDERFYDCNYKKLNELVERKKEERKIFLETKGIKSHAVPIKRCEVESREDSVKLNDEVVTEIKEESIDDTKEGRSLKDHIQI